MRLLRFIINTLLLGIIIYLAVTIPIGKMTLWQHLRAIAGSKESQNLVDEVKQKAKISQGQDAQLAPPNKSDKLTDSERKVLRKIIREKLKESEQ